MRLPTLVLALALACLIPPVRPDATAPSSAPAALVVNASAGEASPAAPEALQPGPAGTSADNGTAAAAGGAGDVAGALPPSQGHDDGPSAAGALNETAPAPPPGSAGRSSASEVAYAETAACLQRTSRSDWRWLSAPASAGERAAQVVAVALGATLVVLVCASIVQAKSKWAAVKLLGGAALSVTDTWTDVLLASEWWRCGHHNWAWITMACAGLSTLVLVAFAAGHDNYKRDRWLAVSALVGLAPLHASLVRVWRGEHADEESRGHVTMLKLWEVTLEAAPQTMMQVYVLMRLGVQRASPLTWASLAISVGGMGNVLGENNHRGLKEAMGNAGRAVWWLEALSARWVFAPFGVVSRALAIALLGCALGPWLALALGCAFAVLLVLYRHSGDSLIEEETSEVVKWCLALAGSLAYAGAPSINLATEMPARGEARVQAWLACAEAAMGGAALVAPLAWRSAQSPGVVAAAAGALGASWLLKAAATAVLLRAKTRGQGVALV